MPTSTMRTGGMVTLPHLLVAVALGAGACLLAASRLHRELQVNEGDASSPAAAGRSRSDLEGPPAGEAHFLWVSDCSEYQEWQSLALLWSIYKHQGPRTPVTRLISGCDEEARAEKERVHATLFPAGPDRRSPELFFTEAHKYNAELNDTYPPYNRPFSIAQWVATRPADARTPVVILDPDMLMLAPLALPSQRASEDELLYRGRLTIGEAALLPATGQRYNYIGARWDAAALKLEDICDPDAEGCLQLRSEDVEEYFSVGPPWIVSFESLRLAAPLWLRYAPRIRKQYRQLIAEMYAYVLALASIGVRHGLFNHFVVSYPNAPSGQQAWSWVEGAAQAGGDACASGADDKARGAAVRRLPTFLHYCEIYHAEDWYFMKRDVPHMEVLSCRAPLFAEAPSELLRRKVDAAKDDESDYARQTIRQAWFLCTLLRSLNDAVSGIRQALCPHGFNATRALRVPYPKGSFYAAMADFFKNA